MSEATVGAQEEAGLLTREGGAAIAYRRTVRAASCSLPDVVFLSGFMSDMTGRKAEALAAFCAGRGQGFVRFDYFAHGRSPGTMEEATIGGWAADAVAVVDRLTQGPFVLVGSSMGGWLMLLAALARPEWVAGLVGIAAAPDFTEELVWNAYSPDEQARLMRDGLIEEPSPYGAQPYVFTRKLIEDGRAHRVLGGPIAIDVPVRLVHGMADRDVPYSYSLRLAEKLASADVAVTLIKDGDHRLSRDGDLARIAELVAEISDIP
ncbi:MAG TPA: alpha/beta hydrolase [Alphaproteobacteria bacterium]|nr:alpha/beta hydrolase [Alphaproteobacteria bacterium]